MKPSFVVTWHEVDWPGEVFGVFSTASKAREFITSEIDKGVDRGYFNITEATLDVPVPADYKPVEVRAKL